MATSLPGGQTKVNIDNINDNAPLGLDELATNVDVYNALEAALGAAALLNVGDGLTTGSQPTGTPNDLKLNISSAFKFEAGVLDINEFFVLEADLDVVGTTLPQINMRTLETGIGQGRDLGIIKWRGSNAASKTADVLYGEFQGEVRDATAGSEDLQFKFRIRRGGALTTRWKMGNGIFGVVSGGDVSGGDMGDGTGNFERIYEQGNTLLRAPLIASGNLTGTAVDVTGIPRRRQPNRHPPRERQHRRGESSPPCPDRQRRRDRNRRLRRRGLEPGHRAESDQRVQPHQRDRVRRRGGGRLRYFAEAHGRQCVDVYRYRPDRTLGSSLRLHGRQDAARRAHATPDHDVGRIRLV